MGRSGQRIVHLAILTACGRVMIMARPQCPGCSTATIRKGKVSAEAGSGDFWNISMTVRKTFTILALASLALSSLFVANAAVASRTSNAAPVGEKEADIHRVKAETLIVMGRSVSTHRRTKLHHIKVKPT